MSTQKTNAHTSSVKHEVSPVITDPNMEIIVDEVMETMDKFLAVEHVNAALSGTERRRLVSAGTRNYGFMDKAWDIVHDNPNFAPTNFNTALMGKTMRDIEDLRQLVLVLEQFLQAVNDLLLIKSDECYRMALRVYAVLQEQARNKVPGAAPLFDALLSYFRKRKRAEEGEPTIKELEHDFHRILHGKADGEIKIVNERPHISAGVHEVVDDVHKGRTSIKATEEMEIDENKRK
jgi:hypothetical protein